jgi:hypothetical protein
MHRVCVPYVECANWDCLPDMGGIPERAARDVERVGLSRVGRASPERTGG